ncbi:MAG: malonyl-CoA decarboxylase family protein [Myxococcota bacterium]|nr:malonyl-CoA decarboxylase family protein [Myxococcota bacterium]
MVSLVMLREKVNTVVFFSIDNWQAGLRGVGFGDLLIQQVMADTSIAPLPSEGLGGRQA